MKPKNGRPIKLISGSSNRPLAEKIAKYVGVELSPALIDVFNDGESQIEIHDNMRGCDVFVIQSTCAPANHNVMELYLILDALKRSSCWRVTAVIPYFGYGRQDRKIKPRVPISAKAVADIISFGGIDRVLTIDLHSGQAQGFFNCPVDHLFGSMVFIDEIRTIVEANKDTEFVLVSPDAGSNDRVEAYSDILGLPMATCYKKRGRPGEISKMILLGYVKGMHCILIDDMIDSGGTLIKATHLLLNEQADCVDVYATHGVLSGNAIHNLNGSNIRRLVLTDTIPVRPELDTNNPNCMSRKFTHRSVAQLFATAIKNIHSETSVSCLFGGDGED